MRGFFGFQHARHTAACTATLTACIAVAGGAGVVTSRAAEAAPEGRAERVQVEAGFEGVVRIGAWTPVAVRIGSVAGESDLQGSDSKTSSSASSSPSSSSLPRVFVHAEDPDGELVRSPPAEWRQAADGGRFAATTVRFGRPGGRVVVEIEPAAAEMAAAGRHEARVASPAPSWQRLVLVIGEVPQIERACRLLEGEGGRRPRPVLVRRPADLGRSPLDFDAADMIVVAGSAAVDRESMPDDLVAAIDAWVRQGGRLLFLAGPSARSIAAAAGPAARWLPAAFTRLVPLRRTAAVETFARSSRPIDQSSSTPILVPIFSDLGGGRDVDGTPAADAVIEVFEGNSPSDLPLVVRRAHGFGMIAWAGLEPGIPPLASWTGTDTLLAQLLASDFTPSAAPRDGPLAGRMETVDLADQLRRAIDTFPGVSTVPFEWIAAVAGLYVVSLYPAGWWLVDAVRRRTGRNPVAVAWLSLPVSVAAFTLLAWWLSHGSHPRGWRHSRCDVCDLDASGGGVRAFSCAGTWSPRNAVFDRSVRPRADVVDGPSAADGTAAADGAAATSAAVSWFAPSGGGLGGTDAASPHPSLAAADYGFGRSLAALERVPIAAASSRLFEAGWRSDGSWLGRGVAGRLDRDAQATLRGRLESRLPFPLKDCVLAHAGWLYDVGEFAPGLPFDPAAGRGPRSLAGHLTRRGSDRERDRAIPYDRSSRDLARILEVAGLHAAAGGVAYTSLEGGRLARLDLSGLLEANRAILIGTGPAATDWMEGAVGGDDAVADGGGRTVSVWRIVIPIGRDVGDPGPEARR